MAFDPKKHLIRVQGGKEYLPVAFRLVWFREEHPDWGIDTKPILLDTGKGIAIYQAVITNQDGRQMSCATKMETIRGFIDYVEKAETGAIGRALALVGFGTQFAPELDEGERIVDSPLPMGEAYSTPTQRARGGTVVSSPAVKMAPVTAAPPAGMTYKCSTDGCGRELTKAQHDFSMKFYGQPLCPACQKGRVRAA